MAVDPTNDKNVVVAIQERKSSRVGFVLSSSKDGGETWTKKRIGLACTDPDPAKCPPPPELPGACPSPALKNPGPPPLDPNIPTGGVDFHIGFDRFGGLWLNNLAVANRPDHEQLLYSSDKGDHFIPIVEMNVYPCETDVPTSPVDVRHFFESLDYDNIAIGPDATNLNYDTVGQASASNF